jgi:hypothetical protein
MMDLNEIHTWLITAVCSVGLSARGVGEPRIGVVIIRLVTSVIRNPFMLAGVGPGVVAHVVDIAIVVSCNCLLSIPGITESSGS